MEKSNRWKLGSQNWRLYERLWEGPVSNAEIVRQMGIFNYTGRISEIRRHVDVICTPVPDRQGLTVYQMVR